MNKKILFVIVAIIILIATALTYLQINKSDGNEINEFAPAATTETKSATASHTTPVSQAGSYIAYSENAALTTPGTKLLFFHAPWCPQCREMDDSIESEGVPIGVTVFKVDYDSNQSLRQKYGVTLQTTFVKVDDDGNKIASYVAYEEPQFSSVERELL